MSAGGSNPILIQPSKSHTTAIFKTPETAETTAVLAAIPDAVYNEADRGYRLRLRAEDLTDKAETLAELAKLSIETYTRGKAF